jgi:hypothetical protein
LKTADNCAAVGARSMRSVDDVAIAGSRTAPRAADDALYGGHAIERAALDDGARARGAVVHPVPVAEGEELGKLGEVAGEVGFELVSYGIDVEGPEPDELANAVHRPIVVDLSTEASAWRGLVEGNADIGVAPRVFVGRSEGEALFIGEQLVPLTELADGCARVGASCVFVACDAGCTNVTRSVLRDGTDVEGAQLGPYITEFASARLSREPVPAFIAIVDGSAQQLKLLRPRAQQD